jgi:multiple sugar transport system substrate-binding protein
MNILHQREPGESRSGKNQGWDKDDAIAYLNAYHAKLILPMQQIVRIPGTAEYWHELHVRISSVLSGVAKPKEASTISHQAWEQITDRYGRESQKKLYAESYGEL